VLPLAGEILVRKSQAHSSLAISALIIVPQIIVAVMAPWVGRQAQGWGRRPLLLIGFAALPIRALGFALISDPLLLLASQALDGISATALGVLTALIIADLTGSTGRFNLAQGIVGTASGIGASISTTLSGLVAESLGSTAAFLCIAAIASLGTLMIWFLMPETKPPSERTKTDRQSVGHAYVDRSQFRNGAQHGVQGSSRSTADLNTSGSDNTD
jgi:MFS family permease